MSCVRHPGITAEPARAWGTMISAEQCRGFAQECERLAKGGRYSIQLATALMSMAQSWEQLAEDTARYEAIVKAEAE